MYTLIYENEVKAVRGSLREILILKEELERINVGFYTLNKV